MGTKLLFTGLTLIEAVRIWNPLGVPSFDIVGAVLMIVGCVLIWLDK